MIDPRFDEKTIVITGAARGIGLGIARGFAEAGGRVVLTDINGDEARGAASELRRQGLDAVAHSLDVRDPDQSSELVEMLASERAGVDVWVNNAGISHLAPAENLTREDWNDSMAVMISGTFFCSQAAGRHMLGRSRGVIVNVASVTGYASSAGRAAYSTAKAGVVMLTKTLGVEWAPRGVRVVGVAPSVIMTEMVQRDADAGDLNVDDCVRRTPLHRLGTVKDVADAVVFLAGDGASYITAETMRVDGGWLAYQLF